MTTKTQIFERYSQYENDFAEASQESSKLSARVAKVLVGSDSKDMQRLHAEFFADIEALVSDFAASEPSEADADEVAEFMLREKADDPRDALALSLFAAEKYAVAVIPFMSLAAREALKARYKKRKRYLLKTPVAKDVIRALG